MAGAGVQARRAEVEVDEQARRAEVGADGLALVEVGAGAQSRQAEVEVGVLARPVVGGSVLSVL